MKKAFLEAMVKIYPQGPASAVQWRDLVRVFAMGWVEALMVEGKIVSLQMCHEEVRPLCNPLWMPDDSWRWWPAAQPLRHNPG